MWALPSLESIGSDVIDSHIESGGFWALLLFERADNNIIKSLERNWHTFSHAIGPNAHIITLLHVEDKGDVIKLKFPVDYEKSVGRFCNELGIRLDHLPALIALNVKDPKSLLPIYWSLSRSSPAKGSDALRQIVSDIQQATSSFPPQINKSEWLQGVGDQVTRYKMGREFKTMPLLGEKSIRSLLKMLLRGFGAG